MIGALADPEALLVFGTIVTATSWARRRRESEALGVQFRVHHAVRPGEADIAAA